ncbi:MAG: single-stranded-DNA-specific exonuclease RecJ [Dehalococcoidia bacterium]
MTSGLPPRRIWDVLPAAPRDAGRALGRYPPIMAQLLYNRGIRSAADAEAFLHPKPPAPDEEIPLPNAQAAVSRLAEAVRSGETMAVYGDFDADGVTSSALLVEALTALGARPIVYIPDRVAEGHGLNLPAIRHLHRRGVSLVITADCGVTDVAEVAAAADLGIDTIVTDHHTPPGVVPDAVAVVNPKLSPGSTGIFHVLASVGVAFKLCQSLYRALDRPMDWSLLEFVALGSVADLSPMEGENRRLVREGLMYLNRTQRPGLRALLDVAGLKPGQVDTEAIGFGLGPRINAPGRMGHANISYQLLVASQPDEAHALAQQLDAANADRQRLTRQALARARERLTEAPELGPLLILGDPDFSPGIVGLVAGRLREEYYRPAVVYQRGPEETRASCRSIPEFNIIEALRQCDDLFQRYGGHAQAAGFTIATGRLPELEERLTDIARRELAGRDLRPSIAIDAEIPLGRIDGAAIRAMRELAPYGVGNPQPTFLARDIEVLDVRRVGADGRHLRLRVREGPVSWTAIAFNAPPLPDPVPGYIDLVFTLSIERRQERETLQLNVLDLAVAG